MATGAPELTLVTLAGVDVTAYVMGWEQNSTSDGSYIKGMTVVLTRAVSNIIGTDDLNQKYITAQRGVASATESYVFRGYVVSATPDLGTITLSCLDKLYITSKIKVTASFDINIDTEAGVYSEIFKTLIADYTPLTADATTVQDSGTTITITKFVCRSAVLFERLKTLTEALSWQMYYSPETDKVYFEPKGYQAQATPLVVGSNVTITPKWSRNSEELYTRVEIRGAYQEVETTETGQVGVTAGYTTSSVTLTRTPKSVKVYADASNPPTTLRVGGVDGSSSTYDYSVDQETKRIVWNSGTYTPGASDYVKVDYSTPVPTPVIVRDDAAHALYDLDENGDPDPDTWKETTLHKEDITNVADAEIYGRAWLDDHKAPILSATLPVINVTDLVPGQTVSVVDAYNAIAQDFIVTSVKKVWPYRYDSITVVSNVIDEDDYEYNIAQRVKKLEEQNASESDTLLQVIGMSAARRFRPRYIRLDRSTYTTSTDKFILNHPVFGKFGTAKFGNRDTVTTTEGLILVQGNNVYREFVYDTDFYDSSGSSGITWDTSGRDITFGSSATLLTKLLSVGQVHTYATLTLGTTTGTFISYEISSDGGSTWQTLTLGVRTALSGSTSVGIKLRIKNDASAATIVSETNAPGRVLTPAIKLVLEA